MGPLQELANYFGQHGSIIAVRLASAVDTLKRKAWIEFSTEDAAQSAQSCSDVVSPLLAPLSRHGAVQLAAGFVHAVLHAIICVFPSTAP